MEIRVLSGDGVDLQSLDSYWINDTKSSPSKGHVDALIQSKALRAALFNVNISSEFINSIKTK